MEIREYEDNYGRILKRLRYEELDAGYASRACSRSQRSGCRQSHQSYHLEKAIKYFCVMV